LIKSSNLLLLIITVCACSEVQEQSYLFEALPSTETGVNFSNILKNDEDFNIVDYLYYYNGGGVGIADFNNDGLPDIYLSANEGDNKLYVNKGNLKFEDITQHAGTKSPGRWKTGVVIADVNGDGWDDIYLCRVSDYLDLDGHNELYINNGDLTFSEKSAEYGLDFRGFATHAAFFDIDNDGDEDMYLLNHAVHTQHSYGRATLRLKQDSLSGDRVYENQNGRFVDITEESGIYTSHIGYGLGIGLSDFNMDGYTDLYISNDFSENDYLYINQGNKTFKESFAEMATHTSRFSMGNDLVDINNDGLTDIITLDMLPANEVVRKSSAGDDPYDIFRMKLSFGYMNQYARNTLQINRGNQKFSDAAMISGMHATDWSWAPLAADYDLDGDKDVFISNGILKRPNDLDYIDFIYSEQTKKDKTISDAQFIEKMPDGLVNNYFWRNEGDVTFTDDSDQIQQQPGVTNGCAYADLDNDGDLDLVLNNLNSTASILRNTTVEKDSTIKWLKLTSSCGSLGWIEVHQENEFQKVEWFRYRGFQSTMSKEMLVGLGAYDVDSIVWHLPNQRMKVFREISSNTTIVLDTTGAEEISKITTEAELLFERINGIPFVHDENTFIEFNREALIPHMNSREGPALAIADINNDGLQDIFIGGAKHQSGVLFIQEGTGFELIKEADFEKHKQYEDVDAAFVDLDLDDDLDLVVISGGNEFTDSSYQRNPRVYLNDGTGRLQHQADWLKNVYTTGSTIAVHDFNNDSWPDIFIGGLAEPWSYGLTPNSYLMLNRKGNGFEDVTDQYEGLRKVGMVKDAIWADMDANGEKDLIVTGLWMPVTVFYVENGQLAETSFTQEQGWWQTVEPVDYDADGDMDLMMGNLGLNSKLKASKDSPVRLYVNDFDNNGFTECILTYMIAGKESVFQDKSMMNKQLPILKKTFLTNRAYASADVQDVFGEQAIKQSTVLSVNELRSGLFVNENGKLRFQAFDTLLQIAPINSFLISDFNHDGYQDILSAGNISPVSVQQGRYNAGLGNLLLGSGPGFNYIYNEDVNLYLDGDIKNLGLLSFLGSEHVLAVRNDNSSILLKITH
jgi:hypothetical protein